MVEVAPNSSPPVCRIMDFGKWMYAQRKKDRKAKTKRHGAGLKHIRIRTPKIGEHDLMIKVNHAREFIERGDRVQFMLRFRGRELAHIDEGHKVFERIKQELADVGRPETGLRREGRRITMLMVPGVKAPSDAAANRASPRVTPKATPEVSPGKES